MATSSERSPPPFPDSEDQDVLDPEDVAGRDSDEEDAEDLFLSTSDPPLADISSTPPPSSQLSDDLLTPPMDLMDDPLFEPISSKTEIKSASGDVGTILPAAVTASVVAPASENVTEPASEVASEVATVGADVAEPAGEVATEVAAVSADVTEPASEVATEVATVSADVAEPATEVAAVSADVTEPASEVATVGADVAKLASEPAGDVATVSEDVDEIVPEVVSEVIDEPSEEFVDLTSNVTEAPAEKVTPAVESMIFLDEPTEDFVDILGSETEPAQEEAVVVEVSADANADKSEVMVTEAGLPVDEKQEVEELSTASVIDSTGDSGGESPIIPEQSSLIETVADPLVDLLGDAPPAAAAPKPSVATIDLFNDDDGSDLFADPLLLKPSKQPQKSLFGEVDEDLFGEPLGATSKKTVISEQKEKTVAAKAAAAAAAPLADIINITGPLQESNPVEPADIFTEEAVATTPSVATSSTANSKTNGVHSEEEADIFAEATVELSLDSPRNERKKEAAAKPSVSAPSLSAATSLAKPQSAVLEELDEEEEAEQEDKFDITISVKDPEKIGDGMNAYMAYKVSTQTTLAMFRNKTFTVRRRFSDFLGLYEKLHEKHGPNGFIVPPPPEKSILGMTKVKVGKEDSSSADFVERRRGALERYLQRVVNHPSLLQDPDVREFLEREELPRAVSTQALSGAGFLKMLNKATEAVSKMTIKMNESDVWFEEKLQEVESADQQFKKLHALVESLVIHRKELSLNTASFAKSAAMLGSAEDNTALSRALSQLAEVEDKMEQLHQEQAANDTFSFAELIADFIRLLGAVRGSFDHRMKAWQRWQDAQAMLQKKRETEAKLLWANKPDKLQLAKEEIAEWEAKVTQYERDFDRVSATVRKEVVRFEKEKAKAFKLHIIKYLECLLQSQQQLVKYWEAFLPEAKAIA